MDFRRSDSGPGWAETGHTAPTHEAAKRPGALGNSPANLLSEYTLDVHELSDCVVPHKGVDVWFGSEVAVFGLGLHKGAPILAH